MRRRRVLASIAGAARLAGSASLAGCLGGGGSSGDGNLDDHPASRTLEGQPYLGDPPREAEKLIVGFEDPTCPNCQRFHASTLPDLKSDVIEPNSASFVYRPFRYTNRAWATDAIHAVLEATGRDRLAAWDLLDFYYENTYSLSGGSWADETRSFLQAETDLDVEAILTAADERAHQDVLETAEDDGDAAGVNSTPTFHLFENGGHVTEIVGVQDVTQFEAAFQA